MSKDGKLQPMMVRPTAPVRAFLDAEIENGNASNLPDAFNRIVEQASRDRDDIRRELVTAFGGRDALLVGLLVARAVGAAQDTIGQSVRRTPASWRLACEIVGDVLSRIAPPEPTGFDVAPEIAEGTESLARMAAVSELLGTIKGIEGAWRFEPAEGKSALLPSKQISETWASWGLTTEGPTARDAADPWAEARAARQAQPKAKKQQKEKSK